MHMVKKVGKLNNFIALSIVCIMLSVAIVPITMAMNVDRVQGFDKGPSYFQRTNSTAAGKQKNIRSLKEIIPIALLATLR